VPECGIPFSYVHGGRLGMRGTAETEFGSGFGFETVGRCLASENSEENLNYCKDALELRMRLCVVSLFRSSQ
jgi:hypothetical protein